ncbi:MAG: ParB/RepB/Spo0J family partition protein [Candidatus Omnitrophica bacterium]|nr:ParB/RepB/Spo0J family partition protein [Candidatus Omnitrophota bacterium]
MEKSALGRGLSALITENVSLEKGETIAYISTSHIKKNTFQPRKEFNQERLDDLICSIKEKGVLQPLLVRRSGDQYELIAGERRLRAAQSLNIEKVPAIVKIASDQEALVLALIENIQRQELNVIEEAKAFKRLIDEFNFTQDVVAQSVGRDRTTVTNILRLLMLPEEIQKSVLMGSFSMGHARAILSIKDESVQRALWKKTLDKGLSVREVENLVKSETDGYGKKKTKPLDQRDRYVVDLEEDLQRALGTKVRIKAQKKRGQVVIEYYSSDDLERIIDIIKK